MFSSFIYILLPNFLCYSSFTKRMQLCHYSFKYNKSYAEFNNIYEDTFDPFFVSISFKKYFYTRSILMQKHCTHTHKIYIPIILFCLLLLSSSYYDYGKNILLLNRLMSFNKWINFIYCSLHKQTHSYRDDMDMVILYKGESCTFLVGLLFVFVENDKVFENYFDCSMDVQKGTKCCKWHYIQIVRKVY